MPTLQPPNCFRLLRERGYYFHVFISWPRAIQRQGRDLVERLARDLEDRFRDFNIEENGVFLDQTHLKTGDELEPALRKNLCHSGLTIAILVPSYFERHYCLTEWNITEHLQKSRLPEGSWATCFIPLTLKKGMWLPKEVKDLVYESSFADFLSYSENPETHQKWNAAITALVEHIERRLKLMCKANVPVPDWPTDEALSMQLGPKEFLPDPEDQSPPTHVAAPPVSPRKRELVPAVSSESKL